MLGGDNLVNEEPGSEEHASGQQQQSRMREVVHMCRAGGAPCGLQFHFAVKDNLPFCPEFSSAALDLPVGLQAEAVMASGRLAGMII